MPVDGVAMQTKSSATIFNSPALLVRMPDGGVLCPPALVGDRLIDILARFGISVRTEDHAESAAPFARFKRPWADRLPSPDATEQALLPSVGRDVDDGTPRLLSHIVMTSDLDGLEFELPWDALVPQTYWVAG